jgi:deazaflavin-dependent oxidoreductase (nitroreductase family)
MTEELTNYNQQMIEQFRANGGKMGAGALSMLLLTTTGAKSGRTYLNPLAAYQEDGRLFVVASKAGSPRNPDWYHNLVANPTVTVEHDGEKFDATARVLADEERDQLFARIVEQATQFGEYQEKTSRKIPLVELVRVGESGSKS